MRARISILIPFKSSSDPLDDTIVSLIIPPFKITFSPKETILSKNCIVLHIQYPLGLVEVSQTPSKHSIGQFSEEPNPNLCCYEVLQVRGEMKFCLIVKGKCERLTTQTLPLIGYGNISSGISIKAGPLRDSNPLTLKITLMNQDFNSVTGDLSLIPPYIRHLFHLEQRIKQSHHDT